jgi:putative transposase
MPRPPRIYLPGVSVHVMQRGNNKSAIFLDDHDCEVFLDLLQDAAVDFALAVHGFAVMKNHYHLLATPGDETSLPRTIQEVAGNYCQFFNQRYGRIGTIWNGRYKSLLITDERYWLTCLRYIDQNPVRARIVDSPELYRWSSYRWHAYRTATPWLSDHRVFDALSSTVEERCLRYQEICRGPLNESELRLERHGRGQTRGLTPSSSARVSGGSSTAFAAS